MRYEESIAESRFRQFDALARSTPTLHTRARRLCAESDDGTTKFHPDLIRIVAAYDVCREESTRTALKQEAATFGVTLKHLSHDLNGDVSTTSVPGFVYIATRHGSPLLKIGRSKNVRKRMNSLSLEVQGEVRMLYAFWCEDSVIAERYLHFLFLHYRRDGEWFDLPVSHAVQVFSCLLYIHNCFVIDTDMDEHHKRLCRLELEEALEKLA